MKSVVWLVGTALATLVVAWASTAAFAKDETAPLHTSASPGELQTALTKALAGPEGEYAALATYEAILKKFGDVQPYLAIAGAEQRHIAALQRQFRKCGLTVPKNQWGGKVKAPGSLQEAARAGVEAEQRNVALYDELIAKVKGQADLERVFRNLQAASRERHLPAFRIAARSEGKLAGTGGSRAACRGRGCGMGGGCRFGLSK